MSDAPPVKAARCPTSNTLWCIDAQTSPVVQLRTAAVTLRDADSMRRLFAWTPTKAALRADPSLHPTCVLYVPQHEFPPASTSGITVGGSAGLQPGAMWIGWSDGSLRVFASCKRKLLQTMKPGFDAPRTPGVTSAITNLHLHGKMVIAVSADGVVSGWQPHPSYSQQLLLPALFTPNQCPVAALRSCGHNAYLLAVAADRSVKVVDIGPSGAGNEECRDKSLLFEELPSSMWGDLCLTPEELAAAAEDIIGAYVGKRVVLRADQRKHLLREGEKRRAVAFASSSTVARVVPDHRSLPPAKMHQSQPLRPSTADGPPLARGTVVPHSRGADAAPKQDTRADTATSGAFLVHPRATQSAAPLYDPATGVPTRDSAPSRRGVRYLPMPEMELPEGPLERAVRALSRRAAVRTLQMYFRKWAVRATLLCTMRIDLALPRDTSRLIFLPVTLLLGRATDVAQTVDGVGDARAPDTELQSALLQRLEDQDQHLQRAASVHVLQALRALPGTAVWVYLTCAEGDSDDRERRRLVSELAALDEGTRAITNVILRPPFLKTVIEDDGFSTARRTIDCPYVHASQTEVLVVEGDVSDLLHFRWHAAGGSAPAPQLFVPLGSCTPRYHATWLELFAIFLREVAILVASSDSDERMCGSPTLMADVLTSRGFLRESLEVAPHTSELVALHVLAVPTPV